MNAEFQRIAMRDKKAFFRDQCKEIEEINRMGKTRDLFKKIRDSPGSVHETGCSGLVHWDDPEGWDGEGDGGGSGWGTRVYLWLMYLKTITIL